MKDTTKLDPLLRPVAHGKGRYGNSVMVDLAAIIDGCSHAIADRGFVGYDGSPAMVALSADVLLAVAHFAKVLSAWISTGEKSPEDAVRVREFAMNGPSVGGCGAADAEGSTIHHIHVSSIRNQACVPDPSSIPGGSASHEHLLDALGYIRAECLRLRGRLEPTHEPTVIGRSLDAIVELISTVAT